jgi:type I restriction enzyme, S subunit
MNNTRDSELSTDHHPLIPPGYKQTEVGVIPEDWRTPALGSLTALMTNGFVGTATTHYASNDNGILYIQGYNVEENSFNFHGIKFVTEDFHRVHMKSCLQGGDLLTVQTGEVGLTTIVPDSLTGSNCHALIISRVDKKRVSPVFISYYLNSKPGRSRLKLIETGTTMKHLNVGDMLQFRLPLPPTKAEQQAIAEVLSDADALIESLEQLIAKKSLIKQGAMQELLSGKKRLPGFGGEWRVRRLGNLGSTFGGLTGKTKADFGEGSGQYITFMNVMANVVIDCGAFERVSISPLESQNRVMKGDLLFNGSSETPEEVAMCAVLNVDVHDVFLNSFCFGFRLREGAEADGLFLAYYIRSKGGRELMKSLAQGSTRYNLSKGALLNSTLRLPNLSEQTAIATILSDMDAEIAALEAKLTKARQLKQGMMQELLTGRIRLV